jgi:hypothetical protein
MTPQIEISPLKKRHGHRSMAKESVFLSIKRIFREHIVATRFLYGKRDDIEVIYIIFLENSIIKLKTGLLELVMQQDKYYFLFAISAVNRKTLLLNFFVFFSRYLKTK